MFGPAGVPHCRKTALYDLITHINCHNLTSGTDFMPSATAMRYSHGVWYGRNVTDCTKRVMVAKPVRCILGAGKCQYGIHKNEGTSIQLLLSVKQAFSLEQKSSDTRSNTVELRKSSDVCTTVYVQLGGGPPEKMSLERLHVEMRKK